MILMDNFYLKQNKISKKISSLSTSIIHHILVQNHKI